MENCFHSLHPTACTCLLTSGFTQHTQPNPTIPQQLWASLGVYGEHSEPSPGCPTC